MPEPFWKDNERAAFELLYVEEARIESVLVMRNQEEDRVTLRPIPEIDCHAGDWTAHCFFIAGGRRECFKKNRP